MSFSADGEDLDKVLKQVKDLAKKAGIPADTIESWIAAKGGKIDTDKLVSFSLPIYLSSSDLLPLPSSSTPRVHPPNIVLVLLASRRVADCRPSFFLSLLLSLSRRSHQVKQVQSLASAGQATVEHFDTDKVVSSVKTLSPALASLLALTLQKSGVSLGSAGKDSAKGGKEQCELFLFSLVEVWG